MIKCNKRNSHKTANLKCFIYILIMIDSLLLNLHATSLHYTCRHFNSSHLNFTQLHFTTLHYPLIWLKHIYNSYHPFHLKVTTLHLTSPPYTFKRFSRHFYPLRFTPFIIAVLTLSLKILGLQGKACNASAGS